MMTTTTETKEKEKRSLRKKAKEMMKLRTATAALVKPRWWAAASLQEVALLKAPQRRQSIGVKQQMKRKPR